MTAFGVGHPDWQAYSNWRQQLATFQGATLQIDENPIGTFVTTNWASLHLSFTGADQDCVLEIEWFADAEGNIDIASDGVSIPANCTADILMPVKGNLAQVVLLNESPSVGVFGMSLSATNIVTSERQYMASPVTLGDPSTTVNKASTLLVAATDVIGGRAYLDYVPHDTSANVTVDVYGSFSTNSLDFRIASLGKPTADVQRSLIVPECIVIVRMINSSATVNEVFDLGMTILSQ